MPRDYTAQEVAELLGLSVAEVRRCARDGIVTEGEAEIFSFQDLVTLRKAAQLIASRVKANRVRQALKVLKEHLPEGQPLSAVQLSAAGDAVVARDGEAVWNPLTGQQHLDFVEPQRPRLELVRSAPPPKPVDPRGAESSYEAGCALEDQEPARAAEAYASALQMDPAHAEARINLGRLLHEAGRLKDAEAQYRIVLAKGPHALASFNLAVVLEDLGRTDEAIAAYQATLAADPTSEDAYFNLARIYERRGERAAALRALKTYRSLTQKR
jgi:tetratricopeptide (TPR) repeat protein